MEKYQCRCCGRDIPDCRECRLLQSMANADARDILAALLERAHGGGRSKKEVIILLGADRRTPSYICKTPCFSALEKIPRARERIAKLEQDLCKEKCTVVSQLKQLYAIEVHHDTPVSSPVRPSSPKWPRLEEISTPRVLEAAPRHLRFIEQSSPSVSVSFIIFLEFSFHFTILHTGQCRVIKSPKCMN